MEIECNVVAILYDCNEKRVNICLNTFEPYKIGVSVSGCKYVFRKVGTNAIKSIVTAIITENVGFLKISQGIIPSKAAAKKYLSDLLTYLKPYCSENKKIMIVKAHATAVGRAPIPAPSAI